MRRAVGHMVGSIILVLTALPAAQHSVAPNLLVHHQMLMVPCSAMIPVPGKRGFPAHLAHLAQMGFPVLQHRTENSDSPPRSVVGMF